MNAVFIAHDSIVDARPGTRLCLRCGAGAALRLLAQLDYQLFVLCHGGMAPRARDLGVHTQAAADRLDDLLFRERVALHGYYADGADGEAAMPEAAVRRAPRLLLRAAREHGVALKASWMVGSTLQVIEAGNRAGCRSVLVDDGQELHWRLGSHRVPSRIATDLYAAAVMIAADPASA